MRSAQPHAACRRVHQIEDNYHAGPGQSLVLPGNHSANIHMCSTQVTNTPPGLQCDPGQCAGNWCCPMATAVITQEHPLPVFVISAHLCGPILHVNHTQLQPPVP